MRNKRIQWNRQMVSAILTLAWPTMLEQLMQTAVQYIDTAMVGALGTQATAAVGSTTTVNWLINSTVSALGIGFLAFIAQACGAEEYDQAKRASGQAVRVTLAAGILFTVLSLSLSGLIPVWMQVDASIRELAATYFFILYLPMLPRTASIIFGTVLRAAGDTKTPMKIGLFMNIINVILNFVLIYRTRTVTVFGSRWLIPGADLGVVGAAVSSAVAFTLGGIFMTIVFWRHPLVSPRGTSLKPDPQIMKPCMQVALPNMFQRFGTALGYVAFAAMINALGDVASAAHTIANTVESAFYIPGFGMQTAAATLAGNAYGAGDRKRMRDLIDMFIPFEIGFMILSGASLVFLARPLVALGSSSEDVIRLGTAVLRMVAVSVPFYGFSIIMEGMLQGVGNTREPFVYNMIGMWGVRSVGTYICTRFLGLGLIAAWACMIAHNLLLFVLFLISYLRGKWKPMER